MTIEAATMPAIEAGTFVCAPRKITV